MEWQKYCNVYWNYELSLNQASILNYLSNTIFKDFPNNLPKDIKRRFHNNFEFLLNILTSVQKKDTNINSDSDEMLGEILIEQSALVMAISKLGIKEKVGLNNIDFERILYSQQVVMQVAFLEAFIADSLKNAFNTKTELLKCNKKIEWETIIEIGNWEDIIQRLMENEVYEVGWKTILQKVEYINNKLGLNIELSHWSKEIIDNSEKLRNIIVHNGGRVSQEYIKKTGKTDLIIGEEIPITMRFLDDMIGVFSELACNIFSDISEKFFNVSKEDINKNIWRSKELLVENI